MKQNTRRDDYISRWGGEEFLVVFRYVNEIEAFQAAEKLRLAIESHEFNYNDEIVKCTISFGLVLYNKEDIDKKALVKIADDAMYQAKAKGRNQVVQAKI
jgi:diguanylate cyclase (GGDEF)-like protein